MIVDKGNVHQKVSLPRKTCPKILTSNVAAVWRLPDQLLFQLERLAAVAGCCGWLLWFIIKKRGSPVSLHVHHQQCMHLPLYDDLEQLLLLLLLLLQGISTAICYMNCWRAMSLLVLAVC